MISPIPPGTTSNSSSSSSYAAPQLSSLSPPPTVEREALLLRQVESEIQKVIVGQDLLVRRLLVGLLTRGHLLLEGVPGLAKTLAVKTLARTLALQFKRVQFTPDLLPADLIGTLVYDPKQQEFTPKRRSTGSCSSSGSATPRAPRRRRSWSG